MKSVSVVIPTVGRVGLLERCLKAVLADEAASEVIVVLDRDDPQAWGLLTDLAREEPRLRVTRTPADAGEGLRSVQRARDHGAEIAKSELILAMDDDVIAHPGLVAGHARRHGDRDDLVVVGYMPVVTPRRWPRVYAPVEEYAEDYETICRAYTADPGSILRQLWGGNASLPRARWLEAIRRPRIDTNLEDKELGLLLLEEGMEAVFDRNLRADHWYRRSLGRVIAWQEDSCDAQARLCLAHPSATIGIVDGSAGQSPGEAPVEAGGSGAMNLLLRLSRPSSGWFLVRWGLTGLTHAAAMLRIGAVERKAAVAIAWLAWARVEQRLPPELAQALRS